MKERPILFSAPMVRAILEGRKTQTRRVVKPQPEYFSPPGVPRKTIAPGVHPYIPCPYGQPGDRLWVRETWRHTASSVEEARAITQDIMSGSAIDWRATYIDNCKRILGFTQEEAEMADDFETWRPSIHMPRWASRINLEITGVRVERLQDISETDAIAEGIERVGEGWQRFHCDPDAPVGQPFTMNPVLAYRGLWEYINGPGSWDANPWVWVVEFKRVTP